jgi:hypothetical protein
MKLGKSILTLAAGAALSLAPAANALTLEVDAYVDGRDQLILQGSSAQWLHLDYAAVGRWNFQNLATYFNGAAWLPDWPGHPAPDEIRVQGALSSLYTGLAPALPDGPMSVTLTNLTAGRGPVSIVQLPDSSNAYTLVVEFNDNDIGQPSNTYADWYKVRLDITPVPEPASSALMLAGLALAAMAVRRRQAG